MTNHRRHLRKFHYLSVSERRHFGRWVRKTAWRRFRGEVTKLSLTFRAEQKNHNLLTLKESIILIDCPTSPLATLFTTPHCSEIPQTKNTNCPKYPPFGRNSKLFTPLPIRGTIHFVHPSLQRLTSMHPIDVPG